VAVHEFADARVRGYVRRRDPESADIQRQVRFAYRVAQKRFREYEKTLRHDESGTELGREELRDSDAARVAAKVRRRSPYIYFIYIISTNLVRGFWEIRSLTGYEAFSMGDDDDDEVEYYARASFG